MNCLYLHCQNRVFIEFLKEKEIHVFKGKKLRSDVMSKNWKLRVFSEETKEEIFRKIREIEEGAKKRLLEREHVEKILKAVEETRAGWAYADGGHVAKSYKYSAQTSHMFAAWYSLRGKLN